MSFLCVRHAERMREPLFCWGQAASIARVFSPKRVSLKGEGGGGLFWVWCLVVVFFGGGGFAEMARFKGCWSLQK